MLVKSQTNLILKLRNWCAIIYVSYRINKFCSWDYRKTGDLGSFLHWKSKKQNEEEMQERSTSKQN